MTRHRQTPAHSGLVIRQPRTEREQAAAAVAREVIVSVFERVCSEHRVRSLPVVRLDAERRR